MCVCSSWCGGSVPPVCVVVGRVCVCVSVVYSVVFVIPVYSIYSVL